MAVRRTVLRLGAVLAGLTALGVALPTLAASHQKPTKQRSSEQKAGKAKARAQEARVQKCCDVRVRDAVGSVIVVGQPASVTATVAARRNGCTNVHPRITVSLAGLDPDEIRIERVVRGTLLSLAVRAADAGAVQAADPVRDGVRLCGDGRANLAYRLTFLAGAPAGRATVSAEADNGGGRVLGRDAIVTVVQSPARARPPAAEPPSAAPAGQGASPAEPADQGGTESDADTPSATDPAIARDRSAASGRLSSTLVATSLGALVAATFALVGVLALRQRRRGTDPDTPETRPAHSAESPRRPGPPGQQPTLAARWSSIVSTIRRSPGRADGAP